MRKKKCLWKLITYFPSLYSPLSVIPTILPPLSICYKELCFIGRDFVCMSYDHNPCIYSKLPVPWSRDLKNLFKVLLQILNIITVKWEKKKKKAKVRYHGQYHGQYQIFWQNVLRLPPYFQCNSWTDSQTISPVDITKHNKSLQK